MSKVQNWCLFVGYNNMLGSSVLVVIVICSGLVMYQYFFIIDDFSSVFGYFEGDIYLGIFVKCYNIIGDVVIFVSISWNIVENWVSIIYYCNLLFYYICIVISIDC